MRPATLRQRRALNLLEGAGPDGLRIEAVASALGIRRQGASRTLVALWRGGWVYYYVEAGRLFYAHHSYVPAVPDLDGPGPAPAA